MSTEPLVSLRSAAFGYGTRQVVAQVDLELSPGSFVGVVGPNGSGKTTLLRGVLGLLEPMSGTVERSDAVLGYVPQRETLDAVYPLTVEEVVQMGAYGRLTGWRTLGRTEREDALGALERVGLVAQRRELFASLSGGQRQRALIARALMTRPQILVLDEPTSGVDRPTQELVLDLLTRLNRDESLAIVIVSHQIAMTRGVHEVVWVADGRARRGTPAEMLRAEALEELFLQAAGAAPGAERAAGPDAVSDGGRRARPEGGAR